MRTGTKGAVKAALHGAAEVRPAPRASPPPHRGRVRQRAQRPRLTCALRSAANPPPDARGLIQPGLALADLAQPRWRLEQRLPPRAPAPRPGFAPPQSSGPQAQVPLCGRPENRPAQERTAATAPPSGRRTTVPCLEATPPHELPPCPCRKTVPRLRESHPIVAQGSTNTKDLTGLPLKTKRKP